jgi:O-antigen/teichoic acid export membrane protein
MGLNIFLAVGLIGRSNLLDLLGQSAIVVNAVLVLVLLHRGLPELITLNAAATVVVSLVIVVLVARYISRRTGAGRWQPDASLLRQMMQYGLKIHLQTIASLFLFRIDLLIVKYFRGSTEAGVYSVASQMALLLMLLPAVISTLLFPRIAAEQDQRGALACKVTRHATLVMFVICLLAIPAIYLLPLLYGPAFSAAIEQALILLPGVFLISIAGVLAQHFSGTGLPLPLPLFWIAALVLNTVANFLIVPVHGAQGAAITSSISYALVFVLISHYFHIRTGNRLRDAYVIRGPELRALLNPRRLFSGT